MDAKVLLIAGFPHGGTTITNIVLGQHPAVFAAGELKDFPDGGQFKSNNYCSCGAQAGACEFWREVSARWAAADPPQEVTRRALYDIVSEASGRRLVVDVAHDIERVEEVVDLAGSDLKLIHVIRDSAAVVHSRIRLDYQLGHLSRFGLDHMRRTARTALRWRRFVKRLSSIEDRMGADALRVSYEQLCFEPQSALQAVGRFLDIDYSAVAKRLADGGSLDFPPHLIRGNGSLRTNREIRLRHDDRYKREMHRLDRLCSRLLAPNPAFS